MSNFNPCAEVIEKLKADIDRIERANRYTFAELLLDIYDSLNAAQKVGILQAIPSVTVRERGWGLVLARVALAVAFRKKPVLFRFRAICESWTHEQLMKEMY